MENDTTTIGLRDGWGGLKPFGLSRIDRRQHAYVLGRTGVGKSTLLVNMAIQDIERGEGVVFIDPHGDNARMLLDLIPPARIAETVFFDPADEAYPIGLNVLRSSREKHLVVSAVVSAMKGIWRDSWGPRLEYILAATVTPC
jgi:DNA helicase HerA-like ATPase